MNHEKELLTVPQCPMCIGHQDTLLGLLPT